MPFFFGRKSVADANEEDEREGGEDYAENESTSSSNHNNNNNTHSDDVVSTPESTRQSNRSSWTSWLPFASSSSTPRTADVTPSPSSRSRHGQQTNGEGVQVPAVGGTGLGDFGSEGVFGMNDQFDFAASPYSVASPLANMDSSSVFRPIRSIGSFATEDSADDYQDARACGSMETDYVDEPAALITPAVTTHRISSTVITTTDNTNGNTNNNNLNHSPTSIGASSSFSNSSMSFSSATNSRSNSSSAASPLRRRAQSLDSFLRRGVGPFGGGFGSGSSRGGARSVSSASSSGSQSFATHPMPASASGNQTPQHPISHHQHQHGHHHAAHPHHRGRRQQTPSYPLLRRISSSLSRRGLSTVEEQRPHRTHGDDGENEDDFSASDDEEFGSDVMLLNAVGSDKEEMPNGMGRKQHKHHHEKKKKGEFDGDPPSPPKLLHHTHVGGSSRSGSHQSLGAFFDESEKQPPEQPGHPHPHPPVEQRISSSELTIGSSSTQTSSRDVHTNASTNGSHYEGSIASSQHSHYASSLPPPPPPPPFASSGAAAANSTAGSSSRTYERKPRPFKSASCSSSLQAPSSTNSHNSTPSTFKHYVRLQVFYVYHMFGRAKAGIASHTPSATRISSCVVRNAPCFWCAPRNRALDVSATDRAILFRLNILCAVMAVFQIASGVFCFIIFTGLDLRDGKTGEDSVLERNTYLSPNLWNPIGSIFLLAIVAVVLLITTLITLRVIRRVNLLGAIRYYWILLWLLPIEIFLSLSLFDYHRVTAVWVEHWWRTPAFAWFRHVFCAEGTAEKECMAPTTPCTSYSFTHEGLYRYDNVTQWCQAEYGRTDCESVTEEAQRGTETASYIFFTINAIWGLLVVILLFLTVHALEGIISTPIVQSSKERNIPAWLILPIVGCAWTGATLLFAPSSVILEFGSNIFWIGVTYVVSAGTFFFSAVLGFYISFTSVVSQKDKKRKEVAVLLFIVTMILTIVSVGAIFASSLVYSASVVNVKLDDSQRGAVACQVDTAESCLVTACTHPVPTSGELSGVCNSTQVFTGCDNDTEPQCPAWCSDQVLQVLRTQLKQSATLAAIFLLYAFSALRFGLVLKNHVNMYQIDYV